MVLNSVYMRNRNTLNRVIAKLDAEIKKARGLKQYNGSIKVKLDDKYYGIVLNLKLVAKVSNTNEKFDDNRFFYVCCRIDDATVTSLSLYPQYRVCDSFKYQNYPENYSLEEHIVEIIKYNLCVLGSNGFTPSNTMKFLRDLGITKSLPTDCLSEYDATQLIIGASDLNNHMEIDETEAFKNLYKVCKGIIGSVVDVRRDESDNKSLKDPHLFSIIRYNEKTGKIEHTSYNGNKYNDTLEDIFNYNSLSTTVSNFSPALNFDEDSIAKIDGIAKVLR